MWRADGEGELYTYLPPGFSANQVLCSVRPSSTCNAAYGDSVGRGAFKVTPGQRATLSQRVRLNDVGQANGELEVFMNGQSVINVKGLVLRDSAAGRIRGIQMQTFFGGTLSFPKKKLCSWGLPLASFQVTHRSTRHHGLRTRTSPTSPLPSLRNSREL